MAEVGVEPREAVIEKVRAFLDGLRAAQIDVEAVYLYGSYAASSAGPDSDIDVAVVSRDLNRISRRIDVRMEVIGFRPEQFRDENPLAWEVKTRGLQLV
jgi:predicted nucleotidyltransferase